MANIVIDIQYEQQNDGHNLVVCSFCFGTHAFVHKQNRTSISSKNIGKATILCVELPEVDIHVFYISVFIYTLYGTWMELLFA